MEYITDKKEIILDKELNNLDKFVLEFTELLEEYVVVSGYVSILFGRSRMTEDVDLLIPSMQKKEFEDTWNKLLSNGFWCINTSDVNEAFDMLKEHAIRFSKENIPIPNMEFKIMKNEIEKFAYENKIKVVIEGKILFISPLELQVAYKLHLGSEKDLEDARYLYNLFKDKIDKQELDYSIEKLGVNDKRRFIENGKHKRH